jgi:thiosulfate/3-mercaptopyruvate sulfurtransferase
MKTMLQADGIHEPDGIVPKMEAGIHLNRMYRKLSFLCWPGLFLMIPAAVFSRDFAPIVTTDWLAQNLNDPKLVLFDIRNPEQYKKGHIPGAVNMPLNAWAITNNGLSLELPSEETLRDLLGKSGVDGSSVVVVNRTETDFSRADATRVAWTCIVAGATKVAVLDGGYSKWIKEKKTVTTDTTMPKSAVYSGAQNRSTVASKSYVLSKLGKSIIVDTRLPEDYFGITSKPGHIQGAVNLPAPWAFAADGTFRSEMDLRAMATGVIGTKKSREIIVYCGVGGYASTWWFLLTQMLGYRNVKLYDGSMEEWIKDSNAPTHTFNWH